MSPDDIRLRWAGAVMRDHHAVIRDALALHFDNLKAELALSRHDYYEKGDWRGDLHRRRMAANLRAARAALRDVDGLHLPRVVAA